jgi:tRNA pseudouridine synthase 10
VAVSSKPLFLYGRYTKPPGVSQKRELCEHCCGQGCKKCRATGFDQGPSVEGQLRIRLAEASGSDRMKFTWMGNEDRESRVYSPGRPFVVELKSPVKRQVPMKFRVRSKGGFVSVSRVRVLPSRPIGLPAFRFKTEITATAAKEVDADSLAEACRRFKRAIVRFERPHERPVQKTVYSLQTRKRGRTLMIDAELDGGLPVKRFVSGELVSPSVSEVLKTEVRCRKFDIREVKETGKFEFGKVTRL